MKLLPIRLTGLVSAADIPPIDAPVDAWNIAQEVHFRQPLAERVLQGRLLYGDSTNNDQPLHIRNSYFEGVNNWVVAVSDELYCVQSDGTWTVITEIGNAPATSIANDFTSCELNGIPVLNYREVPVYWLRDPLTDAVSLPDWGTGDTCKAIRAYKNYLIALNYNDGTNDFPSLIKWSDAAAPGNVPLEWTPSPTNDAGEFSAGGVNEGITDGLVLRDSFMVYKPHSTFIMQYVGGNSIMALRQLSDSMGCLAANCVAELNGFHIVLGQGDVYITDGQTIKSLVTQKVRQDLANRIDPTYFYESYVVAYPKENEVWICFPEVGQTRPTLALVWYAATGQFSYRSIRFGNAGGCAHMAFGNVGETLMGEVTWASRTTTWTTDTSDWNSLAQIPALNGLIGIKRNNPDGTGLLLLDAPDGQDTSAAFRPVVLVKYGMDFGERDSVKYMSEVWPRFVGDAGTLLSVQCASQLEPDGQFTFGPAQDYIIGTTRKIDCRITGRFLAIYIKSNSEAIWRLTGFDVRVEPVSRN